MQYTKFDQQAWLAETLGQLECIHFQLANGWAPAGFDPSGDLGKALQEAETQIAKVKGLMKQTRRKHAVGS